MKKQLISITVFILCGCETKSGIKEGLGSTMSIIQKENPYYSRTDTAKLNIPDSEWKKILPADVYEIAREKEHGAGAGEHSSE
mgnify:CR=1 FL=1